MKKAPKKVSRETRVSFHGESSGDTVENSKRRRMFSLISGDEKFFEKFLSVRYDHGLAFFSKTSFRNR